VQILKEGLAVNAGPTLARAHEIAIFPALLKTPS
jgi:hypothetical protein